MQITDRTVHQLQEALCQGEVSSVDITRAYLSRIEKVDDRIGAFLTVTEEEALHQAAQADRLRREGKSSALLGIPAALKDNLCTRGVRTSCASRMLEQFVPPYSAHAWDQLDGCVLLGKTNMDEFGMGSTTENSAFQITRNPRRLDRVPGGSSGGSAACVAAGEAPFALGSDTGGSVRQPAAFCGVVGMKPTYGLVSRYGLVAFASSLDQIGPLTRNVADNALVLSALAGHDPKDATSLRREKQDLTADLHGGVKHMRIGLPREMMAPGLSDAVRRTVERCARLLEERGAEVTEVSLPSLTHALPAYYVMSSAEASSNLARFDGVRYGRRAEHYDDLEEMYLKSRSEGFGSEVKRRILLGTYALSEGYYDAYYKKALQVRTLVIRDFDRVFTGCDALLSPVAPTTAFSLGEKTRSPMDMYLGDIHTVPANVAGIPALSLPGGKDEQGLPVGVQLMGPAFSEPTLYRIGQALEEAVGDLELEVAL